jgi:hypothetical protein
MKCGLCNEYIDEAKYRAHVAKCGLSEEEEEVEPVLKICPLCGKQVKDLAEHCQRCTGGSNPINYTYKNQHNSTVLPVRSYNRFIFIFYNIGYVRYEKRLPLIIIEYFNTFV